VAKNKYNEKRRSNRLMKKIFKILESGELKIVYKKSSKYRGYFISDNKIIALDPRDEVIQTLVHECLHALFFERKIKLFAGESEEDMVLYLEKFCRRYMSYAQAIYLTELLAKCLVDENI